MNLFLATTTTPAQRQAAKAAKKAACSHVRTEYADGTHWSSLARLYGIRMPIAYYPATEARWLKRACKKLGVDLGEYMRSTGFGSVGALAKANPGWSALAMIGLLLEWHHETNRPS